MKDEPILAMAAIESYKSAGPRSNLGALEASGNSDFEGI
jgi:hypothetical protein